MSLRTGWPPPVIEALTPQQYELLVELLTREDAAVRRARPRRR